MWRLWKSYNSKSSKSPALSTLESSQMIQKQYSEQNYLLDRSNKVMKPPVKKVVKVQLEVGMDNWYSSRQFKKKMMKSRQMVLIKKIIQKVTLQRFNRVCILEEVEYCRKFKLLSRPNRLLREV